MLLRRVLELYESARWAPVVAPEARVSSWWIPHRFRLSAESPPPRHRPVRAARKSGVRPTASRPVTSSIPWSTTCIRSARRRTSEIDTLIHDPARRRWKSTCLPGYPMTGRSSFLFKRTALRRALRHNMYATFHGKPMAKIRAAPCTLHRASSIQEPARTSSATADGFNRRRCLRSYRRLQK